MKSTFQNYIYMCQRLKKFYRRNEMLIDQDKELSNNFHKLTALCDKLCLEFEKSVSNYNGFSIERARKREELQNNCIVVSSALVSLRSAMKYKLIEQLTGFVDHDLIELSIMNEEELLDYASNLYDIYLICEPRLKIQGFRQKDIDSFVSSLTLFALDYPMNKYLVEMRNHANLQSMKAHAELNEFIEQKLDASMLEFGKQHPELYTEYQKNRELENFDFEMEPDFQGELTDGDVHVLASLPYDRDREFRMKVEGGNAIWGLGNKKDKIDNCRPVNSRDSINIISRWLGDSGNYLMIQNVNPNQKISFKVWVTES